MEVQIRKFVAVAIAAFAMGSITTPVLAQEDASPRDTAGADQPVHCDSPDRGKGRQYCGRPHVRYTIEAPANPSCVEGKTWGSDDDRGVWVSGGCSGDFDGYAITSKHG